MPEVKFEVDVDSPPDEQPTAKPFNRWHPDIPPVVEAEPGETIRLEALDWTGGQISDNDDPNEVETSTSRKSTTSPAPCASRGGAR